jgi:hypothetical protein
MMRVRLITRKGEKVFQERRSEALKKKRTGIDGMNIELMNVFAMGY